MIEHRKIRSTAYGMTLALVLAGPVAADDTEVLVKVLPQQSPNVLLLFDTSGSMNSEVVVGESYDPAVVYTGSCFAGRIYYTRQTSGTFALPDCAASTPFYMNVESQRCNKATVPLAESGFYTDRFAHWNDDPAVLFWEPLTIAGSGSPTPGEERLAECGTDAGSHGDGNDPTHLWPAHGIAGPWSDNPDDLVDWDGTGDTYTLFSANYLNWIETATETVVKTRMEILQDVAGDLINTVAGVRIGLMRFSRDGEGGMVVQPVDDVDTNRAALVASIQEMKPGGQTPLAETLYEAGQYMGGRSVQFGVESKGNDEVPQPSHPGSVSGTDYISPIIGQCQDNFIVLLTDGQPTDDTDADSRIQGLPNFEEATGAPGCDQNCLDEMSSYLFNADQSTSIAEDQTISTYTIGFHTDQELLLQTATATRKDDEGNEIPGYYLADDTIGLQSAFASIIEDIQLEANTFAAPAVSVDSFNRLTNRDEVYFTMFEPSGQPHWKGNLKKYGFRTESSGELLIVDASDPPITAIDAGTGLFSEGTRSFWSNETDGREALLGGLRSRMTASRNLYADVEGKHKDLRLDSGANQFHEDNDKLTAALLGVDDADRDELIQFLRGVDADGNVVPILGDPLHTQPVIVNYVGSGGGPTESAIFLTTNDGYFHAVNPNPATPIENIEWFSFIPHDILPRLKNLRDNTVSNPVQKGYGLDGPMTVWIDEDNRNFTVESGEDAYVYFGMRRGGRNYYALEVSDRSDPRLEWTIKGGEGDFLEMGQSWSAATVGKIRYNGDEKTVLFIGGGYDVGQDIAGASVNDSVGRALYIVDAENGNRLWWGANAASWPTADLPLADMTNSIPSDIRVIDSNGDGLADRLYVGDMGGRVWRFDIDNPSNTGNTVHVSGGVIASLGTDAADGNRRFYYPPSVAQVIDERLGAFLTISIGTGHRANPLGTGVQDRFYMLRDPNIFAPLTDLGGNPVYNSVTEANLLDVTADTTPSIDLLNGSSGWFIRLVDSGEKVLAPALTADFKIFFSTYLPGALSPSCELSGGVGSGRLYTVDLFSGAPVHYGETPAPEDRYEELDRGGIPPAPVPVFTIPGCEADDCDGDGEPDPDPDPIPDDACTGGFGQITLMIGTETLTPICNTPTRTYWHEVDTDQ